MSDPAPRALLGEGFGMAITDRSGGVSAAPFATLNLSDAVGDDAGAVRANRDLARAATGQARLFFLRQVHSAAVVRAAADSGDVGQPAPRADAVFTEAPGVALGVLVADCAPVLLAEPTAGLVGAAHAGRAGLAAGVVPALVTAMARAGGDPGRMRALIGPAICGQCYEVPAAMRDEVARSAPGSACTTRSGTPGIDLRAGLRAQLAAAGVDEVADDQRCTAESAELFSHRRDGKTGRFAGLIWLAGPAC
jgi:polyphenol oxidase